jgi:putative transposase
VSARYAFIAAEKACSAFPVTRGCRLLRVSVSGFYTWRGRGESATRKRRSALLVWIRRFHRDSNGSYGYRRIHRDLVDAGVPASLALVRRVMRDHDLHGVAPRRYKTTTVQDPQASPAPDLLERDFSSHEPGARLVGDITYLRTWAGWAYLSVVICLATKRVVGWQVAPRASAQLVIDALEMAHRNGEFAAEAIFHSDRGCQYTSEAFARCCGRLEVRQSMGRTGVCWDNAPGRDILRQPQSRMHLPHRARQPRARTTHPRTLDRDQVQPAPPPLRARLPDPQPAILTTHDRGTSRLKINSPIFSAQPKPPDLRPVLHAKHPLSPPRRHQAGSTRSRTTTHRGSQFNRQKGVSLHPAPTLKTRTNVANCSCSRLEREAERKAILERR